MHIHILGICGTFMGSLAILAKSLGHKVTGCDANVYPPMSTQLQEQGIELFEGFTVDSLHPQPDIVIVGNAMSRGNPLVEEVLNRGLPYVSGPEWLAKAVLQDKHVLAVSGTHGKTTTASMLAWLLEDNGLEPGYLIGGVPHNFSVSAALGAGDYFVIEADEYDTSFFDKRSKFVHYRPKTLIINNLEFDHADIFENLSDIQRQFHHLLRRVPECGRIIVPSGSPAIEETIAMGCWTECEAFGDGGKWRAKLINPDGSTFEVLCDNVSVGVVNWNQQGLHSVNNALASIAAAATVGITAESAINSLCNFGGVKRRMELRGVVKGISVYDDFAHHPTAIETTLKGLRAKVGEQSIIAVLEPRSNTMKMGVHNETLAKSAMIADSVYWYLPKDSLLPEYLPETQHIEYDLETLVSDIVSSTISPTHIVVMSNGGFAGIHDKLLAELAAT